MEYFISVSIKKITGIVAPAVVGLALVLGASSALTVIASGDALAQDRSRGDFDRGDGDRDVQVLPEILGTIAFLDLPRRPRLRSRLCSPGDTAQICQEQEAYDYALSIRISEINMHYSAEERRRRDFEARSSRQIRGHLNGLSLYETRDAPRIQRNCEIAGGGSLVVCNRGN